MKAIVFDKIGPPLEVLDLREVPKPTIRADEVLLRTVSAPISPGDFLFIENLYPDPKKPKFPGQIAGNHGAGIVEQVGKDARAAVGAYVAFSYYNTWAEYAAIPAEWLMPLPPLIAPEKSGQFFNIITAWDLLATARVKAGDWLAVSAGNSTVSVMVLQFAKAKGINVVSLVRRPRGELRELGAAAVLSLTEASGRPLREQIMDITKGKGLNALVDNVGGPATGELIRSMAFGGQVVINGGMSAERFELHNFDVLLNGIEIRSHVYRYFFKPPKPEDQAELELIGATAADKDFKVPLGGLKLLEEFRTAVSETLEHPERGKHFFAPHGAKPHVD